MIGNFKTGRVALVICISLLGVLVQPPWTAAQPSPGQDRSEKTQPVPPKPRPVPPNASRVTATVNIYSVWPPGSLKGKNPPVPPDQTLYSFSLEILTSAPESPELESYAWRPGIVIEAFSAEPLAPGLVGQKIEATLTLTGEPPHDMRWLISNVHPFS